jgi:glycosyltransferase involved in cell wall biosynthesis
MALPVCTIIPAHNAEATLARTLRSVLLQTIHPSEIIIVDDGSTDKTLEIAKSIDFPPEVAVTVLSQPQAGVSVSRNRALRLTQQPIVAFLDADDTWVPTKLEQAFDAFQASGAVLLCHGFTRITEETSIPVTIRPSFMGSSSLFLTLYLRNFICTSTVMADRTALVEAGGFPDGRQIAEDYELWLRVVQQNPGGLHVLGSALTNWYDQPGSLSKKSKDLLWAHFRLSRTFLPALWQQTRWAPGYMVLRWALSLWEFVRANTKPFRA